MAESPSSNRIMNATLDYLIRCTDSTGFVASAEVAAVLLALRELKERRSADETTQKRARDAEYCDYPDCEKHWLFVAQNLRATLQKIGDCSESFRPIALKVIAESHLPPLEPTPRTVLETDTAPGGWAAPLDTGGTVELRTCEFCGCKTNARLRRCCNKGYEVDRAPVKASERRCDVCQVVNVHEFLNCANCGHGLQPLNGSRDDA